MANITDNRIQKTLTEAEQTELNELLQRVEDVIMPWSKSLTTEERKTIPKMDDVNSVFTRDAVIAVETTPGIIPGYLSTNTTINPDLALWNQLKPFVQRLLKLSELLSDTMMLAGSEAYSVALVGLPPV